MKTSRFLAGLLVTGLLLFLNGVRAGPAGGGFRGGSLGRGFGAAFRGERFGGAGSHAFVRPGIRFPNRNRFFVRHRRYPSYISVIGWGAFGFPGVYPGDGYLYDYPAGDYGAVSNNPESSAVPVAVPSGPAAQGAYYPSPVYVVINTGNASPASATNGGPGGPNPTAGYGPTGSAIQPVNPLHEPGEPAVPGPDRSAPMPSPSPGALVGAFDKLSLVSWFKQDGKDTVLVENTETKEVREITSEPNKDNLRIVEIHPSINPKLSEVVISNGTDQRAIRFRSKAVH